MNRPDLVWQLPVRVSTSRDGGAWAFWKEPDPLNLYGYVGLASRWLGGSWSVPDTIWHNGSRYEDMNVVAASQTEAWFVREGPSAFGTVDIFVYHDANGQLAPVHQFVQPNRDDFNPSITLDGVGRPWVVWFQLDVLNPTSSPLQYSRLLDEEWTAPEVIERPTAPIVPKIVADSTGTPWIVTLAEAPGFLAADLWALKWRGDGWSAPVLVSSPNVEPGHPQAQAAVSDEPGTNPVVVWVYSYPPGRLRADLLYSKLTGESWTPPALVGSLADSALVTSPDVAVQDSTIWVAYNRGLGKPYLQHVLALPSIPDSFLGSATFSVRPLGRGALLSWSTPKSDDLSLVRIRRLGPGTSVPTTLQELGGERGRAGSYADKDIPVPGEYLYWLDFAFTDGHVSTLGPRSVLLVTAKVGSLLDRTVVDSRNGVVSIRGVAKTGRGAGINPWVEVFDVRGRLIRRINFKVTPGKAFGITWDGRTQGGEIAPAGVYFMRLEGHEVEPSAVRVVLVR